MLVARWQLPSHGSEEQEAVSSSESLLGVRKCFQKPFSKLSFIYHWLTLWPVPGPNPNTERGMEPSKGLSTH